MKRILLVVMVLLVGMTACGRKGPLFLPQEQPVNKAGKKSEPPASSGTGDVAGDKKKQREKQ
ncbi:MAG: lipoprotein [Gammaproteobacteria bacterium]|nr:lipoprotein [Gammaproteobacteria bacterium]